jgi:all-trans-retinol 13,14-reductase
MKYDVIVIGAGMGGLTAGALLARQGLRVLLLEQAAGTGGYVTSFQRDGFTFDATGSFLGGCEEGGEFHRILAQTGALQHLRFIRVETARNIYPDFSLDLHLRGGFEEYIKEVRSLFPEERKGLEEYLGLIRTIGDEIGLLEKITWWRKVLFPFFFWHLIRNEQASLGQVLDRYVHGEGIKRVLSTLPAHLPPSRLSVLCAAALIAKVLAQGVWYPRGGMGAIPRALETAFVEGDGEVRVKTEVERIEVQGGRVTGVVTRDGDLFSTERVVAAINIRRALGKLLSEEWSTSFGWVHTLEYSLPSFLVYLGVKMDVDRSALRYFTYLSPGDAQAEYEQLVRGEMPADPTMIITIPTLLDPFLAPPGYHVVRLMTPAPHRGLKEWGWNDRSRYRIIKEEVAQQLVRMAEARCIPGLSHHITRIETATPLTLERYTANEGGATYGLAPTPSQFGRGRPANKTPIKGLYLAGHYTRPSHGIVGAAISGRFVAELIGKEHRR